MTLGCLRNTNANEAVSSPKRIETFANDTNQIVNKLISSLSGP